MKRLTQIIVAGMAILALTGCKPSDADLMSALARADEYTKDGNTAKARIELEKALKAAPANPRVNLALAKSQEAAGNLQSAFPHYLRAALPEANLVEAQLKVSEVLLDSGRFQDALGRINFTIGAFPNDANALALRADIKDRQDQPAAAQSDVQAALKRDPMNPRALAVAAKLRLEAKDPQGALAMIDRGLARHPDDLRLLEVSASIQLTLNQPEKAIQVLRSIARATPRSATAQRALAELEASNGEMNRALETFKAAVVADPSNQEMQLNFVTFLANRSKADDAAEYLRKLVEDNAAASTYDLILSEFYRSRDDMANSRAVLDAAAKRLGTTKPVLAVRVALARLDLATAQYSAAESQLQSVLADDPENAEALLVRAALATQNGRPSQAIPDLLTVVRGDPVNGLAFQTLAAAYMGVGETALAIDAMRRAVSVAPGDDGAELRLAVFLQSGGAFDSAKELMIRLTLRRPNSAAVWSTNAELAVERKDWDTATRSLARLRELPETATQTAALEGKLKSARGDYAGALQNLRALLDSPDSTTTAIIGEFAKASVGAQRTDDGVAVLSQKAATLSGEPQLAAYIALMTMQADAGRFKLSDTAFEKLFALAPKVLAPYTGYVNILLAQQAYDRAEAVLNAGIAAGAPKGALLLLRGTVEEVAGKFKAALNTYREAQVENPSSTQAANNYASVLADQAPKDIAALSEARSRLAGQEKSSNIAIIDTIAWLDYRIGRLDEAKLLLQRIGAATNPNPQFRFHLAAVLLASGEKANGLALLDSLKGLNYPGSNEARTLSDS